MNPHPLSACGTDQAQAVHTDPKMVHFHGDGILHDVTVAITPTEVHRILQLEGSHKGTMRPSHSSLLQHQIVS